MTTTDPMLYLRKIGKIIDLLEEKYPEVYVSIQVLDKTGYLKRYIEEHYCGLRLKLLAAALESFEENEPSGYWN